MLRTTSEPRTTKQKRRVLIEFTEANNNNNQSTPWIKNVATIVREKNESNYCYKNERRNFERKRKIIKIILL